MKYLFVSLIILTAMFTVKAQQRYKDFVFEKVDVKKNISYRKGVPAGIKEKSYRFDFYQAAADSFSKRPLIIWMHGGGFKYGKKRSGGIPLWSKTFAQRGYVCAAINYRLSKKRPLRKFNDLVEACYDAIEDLETALQFFKQNAALYRIDTNRIVLAGNSAGGIIALQATYGTMQDLGSRTNRADSSQLSNKFNHLNAAAVINFWGAILDTSWLMRVKVPIVSVHGRKDKIVSINKNGAPMFGSELIHQKADQYHIPNRLKIYEHYSHELQRHFQPLWPGGTTKKRWKEAGQFAADFLFETIF